MAELRKCLFCGKEEELDTDNYQFCTRCCWKLGELEVNLAEAERRLKP